MIHTFTNGTIITVHDGWVEVKIPDGRVFQALPQDDPEYEMRAYALGFSSSWEMCKWHDLMHAWLSEALGLPDSPALLAAADQVPPTEITDAEEHVVMALHRYINLLHHAGTKTAIHP